MYFFYFCGFNSCASLPKAIILFFYAPKIPLTKPQKISIFRSMNFSGKNSFNALAFVLVCSLSAFAQGQLEKIAVYVSGSSDAGINKSFSNNLLAAIAQSGKYAEIGEQEAFYNELAKNHNDSISQIAQTAKQYGANFVCVVSMTEAFGAYSISARLIKTADSQVIRTASLNRSLKSLDDLTRVSNELVSQLLQLQIQPVLQPTTAISNEYAPLSPVAAAKKECKSTFNINELVSKIQSGFPTQLKDCSSTLAKDIAMSKSPFGKKTPLKEPKIFMMECMIDGTKNELPVGTEEYVKPVESFVQNILNSAAAADGSLDVKKLSSAIGGMNVNTLINELKTKAANDECVVDEPYASPVAFEDKDNGSYSEDEESYTPKSTANPVLGILAVLGFALLVSILATNN